MNKFNINSLLGLTKSMYESQQKWSDKNWKETLKKHHREMEKLLKNIGVFDQWKNLLEDKHGGIAKKLVPEIFMDSYLSIHFACMGLYKQANVCLRAQLETTLRLVYFSSHPVEFGWWSGGKDEYFKKKDVWVDDFSYFRRLDEVDKFQTKCKESNIKVILFDDVRSLYGRLSQYVHGGILSFQTTTEIFSPNYKEGDFNKWLKSFRETQKYINTILSLGFADDLKNAKLNMKKKILKSIQDDRFKKGLRKSLGLKFRGRI